MAEGGDEDPQRRRVEQPVGRSPSDGPAGEGPVLVEGGEPSGEPLDEGGGSTGIDEPEAGGDAVDDPTGPPPAPGEQGEEPSEDAE